jgi:serine/threonine-protein kinase
MSPEQAEGRTIDGRSDLYSLGVLLHWMLFDELPPRAALKPMPLPLAKTTTTRTGQEPIPGALLDTMLHCLRFEPEDRPPTAESVRKTLSGIHPIAVSSATDLPARQRSRLLKPLLWGLALCLVAAGSAIALRNRQVPPVPAPRPAEAAPPTAIVPSEPTSAPVIANPPQVAPAPVVAPATVPAASPARSTKRSRPSPAKVLTAPPAEKKPAESPTRDQDGEDGMMNPYAK